MSAKPLEISLTGNTVPGADTVEQYVANVLAGRYEGTVMPFSIVQRDSGNRKLEIGHTWLSQSVQRSGINTEVKKLLQAKMAR